jgi:hypothetical protein
MSKAAVKRAFLDKVLGDCDLNMISKDEVARLEQIADGVVAALVKYDELALEVRTNYARWRWWPGSFKPPKD